MGLKSWDIIFIVSCSVVKVNKFMQVKFKFFEKHSRFWKKNLPHVFYKSADLLSKHQNHEEDVFKICVLLRKSKLYAQLRVAPKEIYFKNFVPLRKSKLYKLSVLEVVRQEFYTRSRHFTEFWCPYEKRLTTQIKILHYSF